MSSRPLDTFVIRPSVLQRCYATGLTTANDIRSQKAEDLPSVLGISSVDAQELVRVVSMSGSRGELSNGGVSAGALLQESYLVSPISTGCSSLDGLLGGGIAVCGLTELCGPPGIGKTQFCMQMCITAQLFGTSPGADVVYIDTEGSFTVERLKIIAEEILKSIPNSPSISDVLSHIFLFRCFDYAEQISLVNLLESWLVEHANTSLIILDSIAFHFRHAFDDMALRTRLLSGMAQRLIQLAEKGKLAVLCTNHMTTRIRDNKQIPALGESWAHAPTTRLLFLWQNQERVAQLVKSPIMRPGSVVFLLGTSGLCSLVDDEKA